MNNAETTPVIWTILICSIHGRKHFLDRLLKALQPQVDATNGAVKIMVDVDDGDVSIGAKRQRMLEEAERVYPEAEYTCFVDDDDMISDDYVSLILAAFQVGADCVTFNVERTRDGKEQGLMIHTLRHKNENNIYLGDGLIRYERLPNHRHPVRRDFALATGFKPWNRCEDSDYARRLYNLLQSELYIDKALYHYEFVSHQNRNEMTHAIRQESLPESERQPSEFGLVK